MSIQEPGSENREHRSNDRFRRLFEEAQEGIGITTPEGEVIDANPAALEIFGYSREEIRSINTSELYVRPEERQAALEELKEKGAVEGREFRLYRASGEEFICRLSASILRLGEGEPKALLTFFRDVTERVEAQKALKESEEMFRALAEGALIGIGLTQEGVYEYANPALAEITGYPREELQGLSLEDLVHPEDWPRVQKLVQKRLAGETFETPNEIRIVTKSGQTRVVQVSGRLIDYRGKPAVIGTMQDVTERRELQEEVLHVQEEERRRLGQELHDGIASQLTGATIRLNLLAQTAEEAAEEVEEVQEIIEESAEEVRRLSHGLNPGGLSEGDLPSALEALARNAQEASFETEGLTGKEVGAGEGVPTGNGDRATHLYRIAQEAVANARRHGDAQEIALRLRKTGGDLVLEIEDDGRGFAPEEVSREGLGLRSMRHRAELLGAELTVESNPGAGTLVRCRLPA